MIFYYRYPLIECDGGFIHKQVLTPWSLNLQSAQLGMKQRILNIGQSELISYISDPKRYGLPVFYQPKIEKDWK